VAIGRAGLARTSPHSLFESHSSSLCGASVEASGSVRFGAQHPRAPLRHCSQRGGEWGPPCLTARGRPAPIGPQQCCKANSDHLPPRRQEDDPRTAQKSPMKGDPQTGGPWPSPRHRTFLRSTTDPLSLGRPCQGRKIRTFVHSPAERNRRTSSGRPLPALTQKVPDTPGPHEMGKWIEHTVRARRPTSLLQLTAHRAPASPQGRQGTTRPPSPCTGWLGRQTGSLSSRLLLVPKRRSL
jgi:hypothetical protein